MKILMLSQYYEDAEEKELINLCNGVVSAAHHKFVKNIFTGLKENKVDVRMMATLPVGNFPKKCKRLIFNSQSNKDINKIGFINLPYFKHIIRRIRFKKYINEWILEDADKPHVVLVYDLYLPFYEALIKDVNNKGIIIIPIIPDIPGKYCIEYSTYNLITRVYKNLQYTKVRKLLQRVDGIVALTEAMTTLLGVENKKNIVMEGIVNINDNVEEYQPFNSSCEKKEVHLLYAGEVSNAVGIDLLIEAFNQIDLNLNYYLHICGKGDAVHIVKMHEDSRIIYHGFLNSDEMRMLEKQIDIYINPRTNDSKFTKYSFPSKNLEYLKTGKPVIAYKLDGIPKEYDGILCYPDDETSDALYKKIMDVSQWSISIQRKHREKQMDFIKTKEAMYQTNRILELAGEIIDGKTEQ